MAGILKATAWTGNMIRLRILSDQGIEKFREYIQSLKDNPNALRPDLNIEPYSNEFQPSVEIDEMRIFSTKMELGEYLLHLFEKAGIGRSSVIGIRGLWTWLAYLFFDQLCPIVNGARKLREIAKYICSSDYTDYYRHFVAAPYDIYSLHRGNSKLFLYNPLYEHNDFIEQFASKHYIISNIYLIEAILRLYWDENKNRPKTGAQSKSRLGYHIRLKKVFDQFELTYDIYSMTSDEILNLLPEEFDDWKR
jgi:hypothetical protein